MLYSSSAAVEGSDLVKVDGASLQGTIPMLISSPWELASIGAAAPASRSSCCYFYAAAGSLPCPCGCSTLLSHTGAQLLLTQQVQGAR